MLLSLVLAIDEKNALGKNNSLPWHLPADLKRFKNITMGHTIIMGRNTYESIGRTLPGRSHIVLSRNANYMLPPYISTASSLSAALPIASAKNEEEAMVIGGAQVFAEAISRADKIYLTRIHATFDADTFLQVIKMDDWDITEEHSFAADEKNPYPYTFLTLERKKPEPPAQP